MLHVILGILKVIGILLLALLGLLLLAVLALLFVPLRYELAGKKKEGALAARGRVTWFLHALSLTAGYRDGSVQVRAKVFGFTLLKLRTGGGPEAQAGTEGKKKKKGFPGKRGASGKKEPKKKDSDRKEEILKTETLKEETAKAETAKAETSRAESSKTEALKAESPKTEALKAKISETEISKGQASKAESFREAQTERTGKEPGREELDEKKAGERITEAFSSLTDFLLSLPERLLEGLEWIQELFQSGEERLEGLVSLKDALTEKVDPFVRPEAAALYRKVLKELKYLWRHYGFRSVKGWIRFGTGAPDLTGQLTGLIYLLLPACAEDFEVKPDFTERILEADVLLKGRIRACHLAKTAFLLWRDKTLRKMIRRIKGGN